jgi:hypothetical protein
MRDNRKQSTERRNGSDRRAQAILLEFPFIDSHGNLVTEERRNSERRMRTVRISPDELNNNLAKKNNYA